MADEQPKNPAPRSSAAKSHLVYVQAPYGKIDLGSLGKFEQGGPTEVTADEAKAIQEAAEAHGVTGGITVVEKDKE